MGLERKNKPEGETHDEFKPFYCRPLKKDELQKLHMDIKMAGGWNRYLESRKVLKLDENGKVAALQIWEGLANSNTEAIPGTGIIYQTDFPYRFWESVEEQLDKYEYGLKKHGAN